MNGFIISHAEFTTWLKWSADGACCHFIGLFCYKALTVKVEKKCQKMLFSGS